MNEKVGTLESHMMNLNRVGDDYEIKGERLEQIIKDRDEEIVVDDDS